MNIKWTNEKLEKEALKYGTRGDFYNKSGSAYNTAIKRGILDQICIHMNTLHKNWTNTELLEEAMKYKTRSEFAKNSPNAYDAARRKAILNNICLHMESNRILWTHEMLQEKALKYNTRSGFEKGDCNAYTAALNRNVIDKICSHMTDLYIYWDEMSLQKEASKYNTRTEFARKSPSAYNISLSRNILNLVCKHMKSVHGHSIAEKELFYLIKSMYPRTKKIRDRKINIPGKSYIRGFEIDIFVPELNRGIEFDGTYYHHFEYMRQDKRKELWSDEDIRNYHQLKDDWFASKGIKILHIKEIEWKKNKQACIDRCLLFLRGHDGL